MTCTGAADGLSANCGNQVYQLPTSGDVFSCASGPFAPVGGDGLHEALRPPFCAAFNRGTALSRDSQNAPQNWYNTFVHKHITAGVGYAFPFDDVRVDGRSRDGTLTSSDTTCLTINVGGTWPDV